MFLAGTGSIMIGGPIALLIVGTISPEIVGGTGPEEVWRGLATVAGSWIGGGANQTAMLEVFEPSTDLFGAMVTVDIIVANIWLAFLLYGAGISDRVDEWFKADSSAIYPPIYNGSNWSNDNIRIRRKNKATINKEE